MRRKIGNYLVAAGLAGALGSVGLGIYLDRALERPVRGQLAQEMHNVEILLREADLKETFTPETAATYRSAVEGYLSLKRNPETAKQEREYHKACNSRERIPIEAAGSTLISSVLLALYGMIRRDLERKPEELKVVASRKPV